MTQHQSQHQSQHRREHHFDTPEPARLYLEMGAGRLVVQMTDGPTTDVTIAGRDADRVEVNQSGRQVNVIAPKLRGGLFGSDAGLDITVTLPADSEVAAKTGSADADLRGRLGAVVVRTGSGDVEVEEVTAPTILESGSGRIRLTTAGSDLRVKCGSGDLWVGTLAGAADVVSGSGDVDLGVVRRPVSVKTGSGSLRVGEAHADVQHTTGSGDLEIRSVRSGRVLGKGASGDIRVGVPAGVPVWTDLSTVTGQIRSTVTGAGEPQPGQDHVELRARTVSGDIVLTEV